MIGKVEISTAARDADAVAEEIGLPGWAEREGVDLSGLQYVADQRALRAAYMLVDGGNPLDLQTGMFKTLRLSPAARGLMPLLTAVWVDGFAIGKAVRPQ